MNFKQFLNSSYLKENPLCGISTYKDELNLATGGCTRQIKKLVLTGNETWYNTGSTFYFIPDNDYLKSNSIYTCVSTHYPASYQIYDTTYMTQNSVTFNSTATRPRLYINDTDYNAVSNFKTFLRQQYAAGTPVTVWYVLETPTTETITVPSGLSGIEEGYLNQSGTPTPTNPIYPTANTVEKWFDIPHYIHNTSTDTITTLPADIYANDTTATVGLKGQMQQSGTPSPSSPIQPQECGERTGNLFDKKRTQGIIANVYINQSGEQISSQNYNLSYPIEVLENSVYTWSFVTGTNAFHSAPTVAFYDINDELLSVATHNSNIKHFTFTTPSNTKYIRGSVYKGQNQNTTMFLEGGTQIVDSDSMDYIHYGYKIPILNNSQTTNVYLGEVQSTRRIKKLVLDGTENWNEYTQSTSGKGMSLTLNDMLKNGRTNGACTHFKPQNTPSASNNNGITFGAGTTNNTLFITFSTSTAAELNITDLTSMKTYLTQQYAAGTPVTIWYVLATPETAVVNEPLRKIGDYADTVSGITIPTIAGANTISVDTTLQPSEVTATYKGWHPVADVHERENGAWD